LKNICASADDGSVSSSAAAAGDNDDDANTQNALLREFCATDRFGRTFADIALELTRTDSSAGQLHSHRLADACDRFADDFLLCFEQSAQRAVHPRLPAEDTIASSPSGAVAASASSSSSSLGFGAASASAWLSLLNSSASFTRKNGWRR